MSHRIRGSYGFVLIVLLAVLLVTTACQPVQRVSAMQAETPQQANQAVVERFYDEVVNQHHTEVMQEVFAADMVGHELGKVEPTMTDLELIAAVPDMQLKVDRWMIAGDMLAAVVTVSGTHSGADLAGVPATGKPITWSQIDMWRVKDGKIAEVWHNFGTADILQQIGYTYVPPAQ